MNSYTKYIYTKCACAAFENGWKTVMQKQDKPFNFDKRGLLLTMHEFSFSYYGHVYVWVLFVCVIFSFSTNAFQSAVIVVVAVVGSSIHEIQLGSFFAVSHFAIDQIYLVEMCVWFSCLSHRIIDFFFAVAVFLLFVLLWITFITKKKIAAFFM